MACSARCVSMFVSEGGAYTISFDDGSGQEFASKEELAAFALEVDAATNTALARKLALRYWLEQDPDLKNLAPVLGRTVTLDMAAAQPIKVL